MRYAIYLTFDQYTERIIHQLQKELASMAKKPTLAGRMPPHLTLLVLHAEEESKIVKIFRDLVEPLIGFSITLAGIDAFTGKQKVIYAKPLPSDRLFRIYFTFHEALSKQGVMIVPAYRNLNNWYPHVTLAKGIDEPLFQKLREKAFQQWSTLEAHVASVGLINLQKPLEALSYKDF